MKPQEAKAHFGLGESYIDAAVPRSLSESQRDSLREAAITSFKQAIRIDPDYVEAHLELGKALGDLDRKDEGIAAIRLAISINPKNSKAYTELGWALRFAGHYDEAIEAYKAAKSLDNLPSYYYCLIGDVYKETERYEEAIANYQEALRLSRIGQEEYYGLIESYAKLNKLADGIAYFKSNVVKIGEGPTIDGDQTRAVALYALGMMYAYSGDKKAALEQYKLLKGTRAGRFTDLLAEELFGQIYK